MGGLLSANIKLLSDWRNCTVEQYQKRFSTFSIYYGILAVIYIISFFVQCFAVTDGGAYTPDGGVAFVVFLDLVVSSLFVANSIFLWRLSSKISRNVPKDALQRTVGYCRIFSIVFLIAYVIYYVSLLATGLLGAFGAILFVLVVATKVSVTMVIRVFSLWVAELYTPKVTEDKDSSVPATGIPAVSGNPEQDAAAGNINAAPAVPVNIDSAV